MVRVDLVRTDDWEALYVNYRLKEEGHHLELGDVLSYLNESLQKQSSTSIEYNETWVDSEVAESLPEYLLDLGV